QGECVLLRLLDLDGCVVSAPRVGKIDVHPKLITRSGNRTAHNRSDLERRCDTVASRVAVPESSDTVARYDVEPLDLPDLPDQRLRQAVRQVLQALVGGSAIEVHPRDVCGLEGRKPCVAR